MRLGLLGALLILLSAATLRAGESTLANGIHVSELPQSGVYEVIAGYRSGIRDEIPGKTGVAATAARCFLASDSAHALAVIAYSAGGSFEFIADMDRVAVRVTGPPWMQPSIDAKLVDLFHENPSATPWCARLREPLVAAGKEAEDAFRTGIEDSLRLTLFPEHGYQNRPTGRTADLNDAGFMQSVAEFFLDCYGTDRAFVLVGGELPGTLERVTERKSRIPWKLPQPPGTPSNVQEPLRATSTETDGGLLTAYAVPTLYYRAWYDTLVLERLLDRSLPENRTTRFAPAVDPYYYTIELKIPAGAPVESVENDLMNSVWRLASAGPSQNELEAARRAAISYLETDSIQNWFRTFDLDAQRQQGEEWIRAISVDDARRTAGDWIRAHVTASWEPRTRRPTIEVTELKRPTPKTPPAPAVVRDPLTIPLPPSHPHRTLIPNPEIVPERLASGVSIVASSRYAIFVAPGSLEIFSQEPVQELARLYETYRANRILVMAPDEAIGRIKSHWAAFRDNSADTTAVRAEGNVATLDLSAIVILKMILDRKLIEAGLWNDAHVDILARSGSRLEIHGNDSDRERIREWIHDVARNGMSEEVFAWAKEAAIHRFDDLLPLLQSLAWMRDPLSGLLNPANIPPEHVRGVAGAYFD